MARQQETEIPVYVFMGFLDSGKTTFVKETLLDREFTGGATRELSQRYRARYSEKSVQQNGDADGANKKGARC